MASLNRVEIIGFLGRDPEQKSVGDGKLVTFPVAMTDAWTDKRSGERQERTEWAQVSVWAEAVGEIAMRFLKKGSQAYIEGRLETNKYTDKDGVERYSTQIAVRPYNGQIILLDRPDRPADQPQGGRARRGTAQEPSGRR